MAKIFWNHIGDGGFNTGADWSGGVAPGVNDDAILGAQSKLYTVTAGFGGTVNSLQLGTEAAFHIAGGTFTAINGTGGGVNDGTIVVEDNATFSVGGGFDNAAITFVDGAATGAVLSVNNTVTLNGGGIVSMSDSAGNGIKAATPGAVLENVDNNINGSGRIGQGGLTLFNDSAGVIDATGANGLLLNTDGGLVTNAGLIEATAGGALVILGTTVDGSKGGTILADNNSFVTLVNADIVGGALSTVGTGLMETSDRGTQLDGTTSAVHNTGTFVIDDNARLTIGGMIANTGAIKLNGGGGVTNLYVGAAGAVLTGGGLITLSDNSANSIYGYSAGATLTNVDNIIAGAGDIGAGHMTLINEANGVILGNGVHDLFLDTGANTITNAGLVEAAGPGRVFILSPTYNAATGVLASVSGNLYLQASVTNAGLIEASLNHEVEIGANATVNGSKGGVILAGSGAKVVLGSCTIAGGTLQTSGGGVFESSGATLDGSAAAVNNQGALRIDPATALTIEGAIHNTGKISLAGQSAAMVVGAAGATLTGGGTVALGAHPTDRVSGVTTAATLINVDNTLSGAGLVGAGQMTLVNEVGGVIKGTSAQFALTLDTGANTIVNAGLIQARGAAGVLVQSAVANDGILSADHGNLTINGAVTGVGVGRVNGATLDFNAGFNQNVTFSGTTGILELTQSQGYGATVFGFSKTGGTSLDLRDIGFVNAVEATYAGTKAGGVLTVSDGVHTAHIHLKGDYTTSVFIASGDGHGGVTVVDPAAAASTSAPAHQFIAAMAGFGASGAASTGATGHPWRGAAPMLLAPRIQLA